MAVTVFVEVSTTTVADAAFAPLTNFPDTGTGIVFDHTPVIPGQLYIYRARRFDDSTGLFSAWAHAYARAAYPEKDSTMIDPIQVWTNANEALYFALEPFEKCPTQAMFRLPLISGGMENQSEIINSSVKRDTVTARQSTLRGMSKYPGSYKIEMRPEGGVPALLQSALKYVSTATNAGPVSYTHTFANLRGARSGTLIHKIGDLYFLYTGVKIGELAMSPEYGGTTTLAIDIKVEATGFILYDKAIFPTVETFLGISTAILDITTPYAPADGVVTINTRRGAGCENLSWTITNNWEGYQERDGTRTAKAQMQSIGDTSISATTSFGRVLMRQYYRSLGYAADPTGAVTIQRSVVTVPVSLSFSPPASIGGIVNTLKIAYPAVDMRVQVKPPDSQGKIELSFDGKPSDPVGNTYNSDAGIEITNSYTAAQLTAVGTPIDPQYLPTDQFDSKYEIAAVQAGATTTTHSAGNTNGLLLGVDGAYVDYYLRYITGALAGQSRAITAYVGATKTATTAAFGQAPATGDIFVIV